MSTDENSHLLVFTDGGSRGNPGPAGVGVVLKMGNWELLHGRCIGNTTNNVAEYTALIDALRLIDHSNKNDGVTPSQISFRLDSELVVKQVRGEYKVKDAGLQVLHRQVHEMLSGLDIPYTFTHIRRCFNKEADALVNDALDGNSKINNV